MLLNSTIARAPEADPALDRERLYAIGLDHVRDLSRNQWTDYNIHDPGITTLELACYALTDLAYRAQFSIPDLLADPDPTKTAKAMQDQFFRPREILPCRPLTASDYRKLLIDRKGVRNAWILAAPQRYFADTIKGILLPKDPGGGGIREVDVKGLYRALVELEDDVADPAPILAELMALLQANRNLCEDFVAVEVVPVREYSLCAELELEPGADAVDVAARIRFAVARYLSPPVPNRTLAQMLARTRADGSRYTLPEIFEGPELDHGFIADDDLESGDLLAQIRLSDVVSLVMDIDGVRAVRDIAMNALGTDGLPLAGAPPDKWRIAVPEGTRARLSAQTGRLVLYKRGVPAPAPQAAVQQRLDTLQKEALVHDEALPMENPALPLGRHRDTAAYLSFQNHFPVIYGLSPAGLAARAGAQRHALALQLKGYLLFFDQVMANFLAQLERVRDLFSRDPAQKPTYHAQVVTSFRDAARVYPDGVTAAQLEERLEDPEAGRVRRNRFLDHLLARVGEDFHHYVSIVRSLFGTGTAAAIAVKCGFLAECPALGANRGRGYDHTLTMPAALWDSQNVSGLERRVARLLGIKDPSRRDLGSDPPGEGMYLVENILLRPSEGADPFLPICVDPGCTDCADDDPYSYRLHVVLPADAPRFENMDFRRFVEETIRAEVPAHIVPKICWVSRADIVKLQKAYRPWLSLAARLPVANRAMRIAAFIDALYGAKNVYPQEKLNVCGADEAHPPFILGRTALGSKDIPPNP